MSQQMRLVLASAMFAVLWTLGMIWWTGTETANIVILSVAGALVGVLWYFAMRWVMRWMGRRSTSHP